MVSEWTLDWYEYGGYDSMSAAYQIRRDGKIHIVLDVSAYVGHNATFGVLHGRHQQAEADAIYILGALRLRDDPGWQVPERRYSEAGE